MIVGSGVVGSYLGKQIQDVEIWEAKKQVYEKACSGLISKNVKHLDIDLSESLTNEIKGAKFISDNESFEIKTKQTQAYLVDRLKFQKTLLQDAENAGCKIRYGKVWKGETDDFVLGADGAYSKVRQSMGIQRKFFNSYQIHCELKEKVDPELVEVHVGSFAPGFFGWMIPFDEKNVELGLGVIDGNAKDAFNEFSKKFEITRTTKEQAALIPLYDGQKTVLGNKALIGDAAAQTKATTGGGIVFGMRCAEELAKAVHANDLSLYEKSWRQKYEKDLKDHLRIRKLSNRLNHDVLFKAIREKEFDKVIETHGDMESPKALKKKFMLSPRLWLAFGKSIIS